MNSFEVKTFEQLSNRELYDIMHLRQVVFVVEQDAPYIDADYKDLDAYHVCLFEDNQLLAHARVIPPGISYQEASIGRVVTHPDYRRKGFGRPLMKKCVDVLENELKTTTCRISAQTYLVPFYSEFGFEVCSKEYLEDGLPHFEMIRK